MRLQELEREQQLTGTKNDFLVLFFFRRGYLTDLLNQCYCEEEDNFLFCSGINCEYCKKSVIIEEELRENKFNSSNSGVVL